MVNCNNPDLPTGELEKIMGYAKTTSFSVYDLIRLYQFLKHSEFPSKDTTFESMVKMAELGIVTGVPLNSFIKIMRGY